MLRPAALLALCAACGWAQTFTSRGFFETRNTAYFQEAPGDSGLFVSEELLRWEPSWKPKPWLRLDASFDARVDTHRQFERDWRVDFADRGLLRPAFSARRLSATLHKGGLSLEIGRQFIRWGATDILNPTDRFAPKDYLNVLDTSFLGVTGARLTWERGSNTVDAVWQPIFTPSRAPLVGNRWVVLPDYLLGVPIRDPGSRFPGGSQTGIRWSHRGHGYESGLCFFDGRDHQPLIGATGRYYPRLRLYGGDLSVPLRWFTVKGEAAFFTSSTPTSDEYVLWVTQIERQTGEWTFVGGYAGQSVTRQRYAPNFSPERGLAETFLGRASYNLDANRSVAFEAAVRQTGAGGYGKAEFSQAVGAHLRLTAAFVLLGGDSKDFLGQYHHNSNFLLVLRYSF